MLACMHPSRIIARCQSTNASDTCTPACAWRVSVCACCHIVHSPCQIAWNGIRIGALDCGAKANSQECRDHKIQRSSYPHIRTRTRTRTHACHAHAYTHDTRTRIHAHTHTHMYPRKHARSRRCTCTCIRTHTRTHGAHTCFRQCTTLCWCTGYFASAYGIVLE